MSEIGVAYSLPDVRLIHGSSHASKNLDLYHFTTYIVWYCSSSITTLGNVWTVIIHSHGFVIGLLQ